MKRYLLMLLLVACTGDSEVELSTWHEEVLPNGAIRVLNTPPGLWNDETRWRLSSEFVLGELSDPEEASFSAISGLVVDSDGQIYVLDPLTSQLRVFSRDGRHVRTVGGPGQGPGEYVAPNGLLLMSGDTVVIVDQRSDRFTILGRDGEFIRTVPRRLGFFGAFVGNFFGRRIYERTLVLESGDPRPAFVGVPLESSTDSLNPSSRLDTIFLPVPSAPLYESFTLQTGGGGMMMPVPFSPFPVHRLDSSGRVWSGHSSEFRILATELDGDTLREVFLTATPERVTPAEIAEWEATEFVVAFRGRGGQIDLSRIPSHRPYFDDFYLDADGFLWIGIPTNEVRAVFAVFDPEGRFLGEVVADGVRRDALIPPVVQSGRLYLVGRDQLDVPQVHVFVVGRPS